MRLHQKVIVTFILFGLVGLMLLSVLIHLLTESWWFSAVDFLDVFWTKIRWQVAIWGLTFAVYGVFLWFNYWLAIRLTPQKAFRFFEGSELQLHTKSITNLSTLVFIFIFALGAANASAVFWETSLKFLNASDFGRADPIYSQDIGFYLFQLPFYEGLQTWLLFLLVTALILAIAVYLFKGVIKIEYPSKKFRIERPWQQYFQGKQKAHISLLLAAIAIVIAGGFWLRRYELLYSAEGVVLGAGYTDTHARLFGYWVMSISSLILGFFFILAVWSRRIQLPFYGVAAYIVVLVLVTVLLPGLQQQLIVEPNELDKELPYIKHNIEYTRQAYKLTDIETEDYPVSGQLTSESLAQTQGTIRNIRLWDYRPLLSTYRQLQEIRPYYRFRDVDIDRYTLNGNYRQVMLSPRELDYDQVPNRAKTWVNERLKYTHGYGIAMSPVNLVSPDGLPVLFIKNIPPVSEVDLDIRQPAIYYGEEGDRYIFTGMSTPEFDYPQGESNAFTLYEGAGGVPIQNFWRRLVYAYDFRSLKILISNYFTDNSRIHYYRQIRDRVAHIAPFLHFDRDPYITVINGKLQWIIDAYTVSNHFPYSEPIATQTAAGLTAGQKINYIRNSVKVLVDAKDGTMQFWIVDETDPVAATYRKIFPSLFQEQSTIPAEVRDHFRYPLDLFRIQAQMYLSYHMDDPQVFYNREDLWRVATENYEGNQQPIEPYYQIMSLPGEDKEEFVLILPFTPVGKDNMIAWMAARSDGVHYGKLLLYEFPKQELIYGPFQIEARIDQNPEISQQLTLWSQEGSRVIRGDLLVIPINGSLLYVEPVYLRAEQGELPELRRVIVAYNQNVIMRPTLAECLAAILGDETPTPTQATPPSVPTEVDTALIQQASEIFEKAEAAMREGNWAEYGRYQQQLKEIFEQFEQN